jgi:outer membrane protein assembly factor BamE (lipoprotein component of BamABCDE complex)
MKFFTLLAFVLLSGTACYQRQDPVVRAAQDLQHMANDLVTYEEERGQRFQSVHLGMSQGEVMKILGAPATQRLVESGHDEQREEWTYRASLRPLGTLTFVNRKVVEIRAE